MPNTNGGKPHICGEIQVHNGDSNGVHLCLKCNMAVDKPSPLIEKYVNKFQERFECFFVKQTHESLTDFLRQSLSSALSEQLQEEIEYLEKMKYPTQNTYPITYEDAKKYNAVLDELISHYKDKLDKK